MLGNRGDLAFLVKRRYFTLHRVMVSRLPYADANHHPAERHNEKKLHYRIH